MEQNKARKLAPVEVPSDGALSPAVDHALTLCREALAIIDQEDLPPHIGARLDHVIADLDELAS